METPQIITQLVSIDILEQITFGNYPGIIVIPDKMNHIGSGIDLHQQLRFNLGSVISSGISGVGIPGGSR